MSSHIWSLESVGHPWYGLENDSEAYKRTGSYLMASAAGAICIMTGQHEAEQPQYVKLKHGINQHIDSLSWRAKHLQPDVWLFIVYRKKMYDAAKRRIHGMRSRALLLSDGRC